MIDVCLIHVCVFIAVTYSPVLLDTEREESGFQDLETMDSGLPIGELPHSLCWLCVVHSLYCSASIVLGCNLVLMYMYRSSVALVSIAQ